MSNSEHVAVLADAKAAADLVTRLRKAPRNGMSAHEPSDRLFIEAADEIERLKAALAEMKRCIFGGNYGRCTLESGHDGRHQL